MLQTQFDYPEFVPDQVLTSDNLNELFDYLEEQERVTRTNLIGIGIVCGLEVKTNAAGTQLTITAGCGVTSGGYLVSFPETTFTEYATYNALQEKYYEKFVDIEASNSKQLFHLDELVENAAQQNTAKLSAAYLADKVVLLYVEILEQNAKNCNPNSCDDKGKEITITFRPLLISKADEPTLQAKIAGGDSSGVYTTLPMLKMHRFNVPYKPIASSLQLVQAYQRILSAGFIEMVQKVMTEVYTIISPLVIDLYATNPFNNFATTFKFLYDGSLTAAEATNIQYYYDFFSDLLLAYEELRETGLEIISMCSPDVNLFRLHLLLDVAMPGINANSSTYRQYFIPSPVMDCKCSQTSRLRLLYKRMVLMFQNFLVPTAATGRYASLIDEFNKMMRKTVNTPVRITPSKLGDVRLGCKSIPYYYSPTHGTDMLYKSWSTERSRNNTSKFILSYNAIDYTTDDHTLNPLHYDIEPYNFLRIEGHIGQQYSTVLSEILQTRQNFDLPFEIVAVSADPLTSPGTLPDCQMQDVVTAYRMIVSEFIFKVYTFFCYLTKQPYPSSPSTPPGLYGQMEVPPKPFSEIFDLANYKKGDFIRNYCTPVGANTYGAAYLAALSNNVFTNPLVGSGRNSNSIFLNKEIYSRATNVLDFWVFQFIDSVETMIWLCMTDTIGTLDMTTVTGPFLSAYGQYLVSLEWVAGETVAGLVALNANDAMKDALNANVYIDQIIADARNLLFISIADQLQTLKSEFEQRLKDYNNQQYFLNYYKKHPGMEHKAGVTKGGTFILVYHEKAKGDQGVEASVANGAVIADFYVPYVCCSDCPPVAYIYTDIRPKSFNVTGGGGYCPGSAGVSVGLDGSELGVNYQLYNGKDTAGKAVPGTGSALDFGLQTAEGSYTVVATNATTGLADLMSGAANVSLNKPPASFNVTGGGGYCAGGDGVKVGLSGSANGNTYQLLINGKPTGNPLTGNGSALDFGVQTADGTYTVQATDPTTTCGALMTGSVNVTKNPLPAQFNVGGGGTYCSGGAGVSVTLSGSEKGVNYQLLKDGTTTGKPVAGTGAALDFGPQTAAGGYTVTATNATTPCSSAMTGKVAITVADQPKASFTVTDGSVPTTKFFTNTSKPTGSPTWDFGDGSPKSTDTKPSHDYAKEGTFTVTLTVSNGVCSDTATQQVTIALPAPTVTIKPMQFCANDQVAYPINVSPAGGTLTIDGKPTTTFQFIPVAVAPNITAAKTIPISYTVNGKTTTVNVTVNPVPTTFTVGGGGRFCAGSPNTSANVTLSGSESGVSYQLMLDNDSKVGSPVTGTGKALDFGQQKVLGTYTVVATRSDSGCATGMQGNAIVATNPLPTAFTLSVATNNTLQLSGSETGVNYQLLNTGKKIGPPVPGTGKALNFGNQSTGTFSVVATNATTGCTITIGPISGPVG